MISDIEKIYKFIVTAEALKNELRHSWTSSNRQESVAEHSWRLSLMVVLLLPYLKNKKLDSEKLIKLAVLHDLSEILAKDVPYHLTEKSDELKALRHQLECAAMHKLSSFLPKKLSPNIKQLWMEFENLSSEEARIIRSLDKIEVCMQHNSADPETWLREERESIQPFFSYLENLPSSEPSIIELKKLTLNKTAEILNNLLLKERT